MRSSPVSILTLALVWGSMLGTGLGQAPATGAASAPQLVLENEYVRVLRVAAEPGQSPIREAQERDVVIVPMGGPRSGKDGEVSFVSKGSKLPAPAASSLPYDALLVELKQHWEAPVRPCAAPMSCARKITVAGVEVGETKFLFSNGFVSGYHHRLVAGGTLNSSYYSAQGTNRILIIALTDLHASLGGIEEDLLPGQVYFSDQTEVEVNARSGPAAWVVVRILSRK